MSDDGQNASAIYPFKKKIGPLRLSHSLIQDGDRVYLERYVCEFGERRSSIRLHIFREPDIDLCLHDHPWWFVTFVLWGGYVERYARRELRWLSDTHAIEFDVEEERKVRWFGFRPRNFRHCVTRLLKKVAVTVIITGPIEREWGFYTNRGWINWKEFTRMPLLRRLPWCSSYEENKQ